MLRLVILLAVWVLSAGAAGAQTAEAAHAITGATDTFLNQGVVGAVAVFGWLAAIGLFWLLWSTVQAEQRKGEDRTTKAIGGLNAAAESIKGLTEGLKGMDERALDRHEIVKGLPEQLRDLGEIGKRNGTILENNKEAIGRIEDRLDDRTPRRRTGP